MIRRVRNVRFIGTVMALWFIASLGSLGSSARAQAMDAAFTLPHLLAGEPGASVSYVVTQVAQQIPVELTGLFLLAGGEEMRMEEVVAVGVRYTVLEADPQAGTVRLSVQAQALDPGTYEPLTGLRWEGTYLLSRDGAEWEGGHNIPDPYAYVIRPDWLGDWSLTPASERPRGPLEPGASWEGRRVDLDDELFPEAFVLPVTGVFAGWETLHDGTRAARVTETGATVARTQTEMDSVPVSLEADVAVTANMLLIPGDFPYEIRQRTVADMTMTVALDALPGGARLDMLFERTIVRDDAGASIWFLPVDGWEVYPWEPLSGSLGSWSYRLNDGTPFDYYVFYGYAGEFATFLLESDEFDAYLFLLDDADNILAEDDDSAGNRNARITLVLPYTGYYGIVANSYTPAGGSYTLTVDVRDPEPVDLDRALELIGRLGDPASLTSAELLEVEEILENLLGLVRKELYGS